jgi:hypothetical protein
MKYQVTIMKLSILPVCAAALLISGCGNDSVDEPATETTTSVTAPEVSFKPGSTDRITTGPRSPVSVSYRVIGTPIVGQPVSLDLQFESSFGNQPFKVSYRVNDPTAMQLPESQSKTVSISPSDNEGRSAQQVTVIPLREGRLYLNVAAVFETESGSMSTVTAIPIQVGPAAPRVILESGTVITDESGELIRTLPAKED